MERKNDYQSDIRRSFDEEWSRRYRVLDSQVGDSAFEHYGAALRRLSESFGRPIDALDVGCGTGRYFRYLRNVRRLVGLDLSPHMLEHARVSVGANNVEVGTIELLCAEASPEMFPAASFELIYSIGVIGEYSPIGPAQLQLFRQLLKPDGILFVTAVDALSRVAVPENDQPSFGRRIARKLFPHLPAIGRRLLNRRLSPFYVSRAQINSLFSDSGFSRTDIKPYVHSSGWRGTHFDCLAWR